MEEDLSGNKLFVNIKDVGLLGSNFYWHKYDAHGLTKEDILKGGVNADIVYIRKEIAPLLKNAEKEIFEKTGYRIYIKEGYRSKKLYEIIFEKRVLKYGIEETQKLLNMQDMPHASGKTVDICLWDEKLNKEVYLRNSNDGTDALFVDFYKNKNDAESKKYQGLQDILISTMLNNGFELGSKKEYFHFNLKKTIKDFDTWNTVKKGVDKRDVYQTFHESEIWWSSIGLNIGYEEDGKNETFERPVYILRKYGQDLFFGLPLSTKTKDNIFHLNLETHEFNYSVLLSQGKIFSSRRLLRKIGKLSRGKNLKIKEALKNLLKL